MGRLITERQEWDAELILIIIDGKVKILKNRNLITRKDLIKVLEK